ncbi:3764_t:CDS:2 [Scutellospora calospora]|uniref:3764_t:CDS:1 n=1 Tax=Scutellospora calospora TaxID=85575 RepID=A0ACA9JU84_9GLOM|nr:3764_t:CDS:2 [Scutellospora calospora]
MPPRRGLSSKKKKQPTRPSIINYRKNIEKVVYKNKKKVAYDQPITKYRRVEYDQTPQKVIIKFMDDNFLMDKNIVFEKSQAIAEEEQIPDVVTQY